MMITHSCDSELAVTCPFTEYHGIRIVTVWRSSVTVSIGITIESVMNVICQNTKYDAILTLSNIPAQYIEKQFTHAPISAVFPAYVTSSL